MRALFALLLLLFAPALRAQPFGRWGYAPAPTLPGWVVGPESLRVDAPGSESLRFLAPLPPLRLESLDERRAVYVSGDAPLSPSRLRFDLMDVGLLLECRRGLALKLASTQAPFLSWAEGSVGDGVPTPPARWFVLSFRGGEPPIVIGLSNGAASLSVVGGPGDWTLRTEGEPDLGWVRLAAPTGREPFATVSAGDLGRLSNLVAPRAALWTAPPAELKGFEVSADDNGVTAKWSFTRPGVVVPNGLYLAPGGGYGVAFRSGVERTEIPLPSARGEATTRAVLTTEPDLVVRLPVRRLGLGRVLTLGTADPVPAPEGFADPGAVGRFALSRLLASDAPNEAGKGLETLFTETAPISEEPLTHQRLLFGPGGEGLAGAAAHALLARARASAAGLADISEPQFVSLVWRRDWRTMRFLGVAPGLGRRAGVLAAMTGALSPDPGRRLEGALFEAGLAAERAEANLLALETRGAPVPRLADPWIGLRRAVFAYPIGGRDEPFADVLRAPLRIVADRAVGYSAPDTLVWAVAPGEARRFRVLAPSLDGLAGEGAAFGLKGDTLDWKSALAGEARVRLLRPEGASPVPPAAPVPLWDETPR